jgi:hypothetical protein
MPPECLLLNCRGLIQRVSQRRGVRRNLLNAGLDARDHARVIDDDERIMGSQVEFHDIIVSTSRRNRFFPRILLDHDMANILDN